jgi:hypothetical protein
MAATDNDIDKIYTQHIKGLSPEHRRQLLAIIMRDLTRVPDKSSEGKRRSLMELEGLGAELWEGVDAQEYVNEIRAEWDDRP